MGPKDLQQQKTEHIGGMRTPVNRVHLQAPLMIFSEKPLVFIGNGAIIAPILVEARGAQVNIECV